jgi:hypothetical protein
MGISKIIAVKHSDALKFKGVHRNLAQSRRMRLRWQIAKLVQAIAKKSESSLMKCVETEIARLVTKLKPKRQKCIYRH